VPFESNSLHPSYEAHLSSSHYLSKASQSWLCVSLTEFRSLQQIFSSHFPCSYTASVGQAAHPQESPMPPPQNPPHYSPALSSGDSSYSSVVIMLVEAVMEGRVFSYVVVAVVILQRPLYNL